ncbi:MAG: hypothetical protein ABSB78_13185 [Bacteroidota bacterium]
MPYNSYNKRNDQRPKIVQRFSVTVEGKTFVRNSPMFYSHAVVGHRESGPLEVLKWCNSLSQANKAVELHLNAHYHDVRVMEVTASPYVKENLPDKK